VIVAIRVLLRMVFALSCTFTACSTVFYISQRQQLDDAIQISAAKRRFDVAAADARDQLMDHVGKRSAGDVARVRDMQLACDGYVSELVTAVTHRVETGARTTDDAGESAERMYRRATRWVADDIERFLADIHRSVGVPLRRTAAGFRRVSKQLINSPWLSYTRNLFNKSVERSTHTSKTPSISNDDDVIFVLPPATSTFAEFLQLCSVEKVKSWHRRFSERCLSTSCHLYNHGTLTQ